MGKFEITRRKNGEYQFNLKASNGQIILTSEGYTSKSNCIKGVDSVKKYAVIDELYERMSAKNGKLYFNLKSQNGRIVGTSELYESITGRENGILSVKINAPKALVNDYS